MNRLFWSWMRNVSEKAQVHIRGFADSSSTSPLAVYKRAAKVRACFILTFASTLFYPFCIGATIVYAQPVTPPSLIPIPRESQISGVMPASTALILVPGNDAEDNTAAEDLAEAMTERGISVTPNAGSPALTVTLLREQTPDARGALQRAHLIFTPAMHDEGYVLIAGSARIAVIAQTASGIFYGVQTLKQMLQGRDSAAYIPAGTVRDWPAMKYRGIDDDLARGPFPTLAFQKQQIRTFASYKINVYSPYLEDNMQYATDPELAPLGRALTRAESQELSRYARRYHITIIPEQEAFGHLHHILKSEKYSDLAESPHGTVFAPHQAGTQEVIKSWFTQLSEDFPGPFLHIGADETFDLGSGRTADDVQKRGLGPVYADFLVQIHDTLAPLNRRLLFWGDVAWHDASAIDRLPKDMIAIPWVYWHEDSYDSNIVPFQKAGIETWVAPGDSNWSVMYPLGNNAIDNISGFVEAGQRLGSTGALTTVWNDDGEGLFNQDWFGVLFGAAASWQPGRSDGRPYKASFGQIFFEDPTGKIMEAQEELSAAAKAFDVADSVFWIDPWSEDGQTVAAKLRPHIHETRVHTERALALLIQARSEAPHLRHPEVVSAMELAARRINLAAMKFQLSDEMVAAYAQAYAMRSDDKKRSAISNLLGSMAGNDGRCKDILQGYSVVKGLYKEAWLAENRPYWLDNILVRYDLQLQLWQQRANQIDTLRSHWGTAHELPPAKSVGIPLPPTP